MATYLDYLEWRGDLSMKERPFNEVDNLIFAELAYFHFDEVTNEGRLNMTVEELYHSHQALANPRNYWNNDPTPLLKPLAQSRRFSQVKVTDFVDVVDREEGFQFSAVTFHLEDHTRYIAFRGTDSSIVGWKEDFDFSYMEETPAQREAVLYLERALKLSGGNIRVGGHSKGGNLAIYAAAFCHFQRKRIMEVYSNDGPGFKESLTKEAAYQEVLPKVRLIIPEASVVSTLLWNKEDKEIIQSTAVDGIRQHLPHTWMVERDHFLLAEEQNMISCYLDEIADRWLSRMNDEEKQAFVSALYDIVNDSGITSIEELEQKGLPAVHALLKSAVAVSEEERKSLWDTVSKLAEAGRDVLWGEARKKLNRPTE